MKQLTVAVTGASGSLCAQRLFAALGAHPDVGRINAIVSSSALRVARVEIAPKESSLDDIRRLLSGETDKIRWHDEQDVGASIASGSHLNGGTVLMPCSTGTLGAIASGATRNLIHRAAEVALKERRTLILGVREAPLSMIHIKNMLTVTQAGAIVLPITPAFYAKPESIGDVVDLYIARVMDQLGFEHSIGKRWGS